MIIELRTRYDTKKYSAIRRRRVTLRKSYFPCHFDSIKMRKSLDRAKLKVKSSVKKEIKNS